MIRSNVSAWMAVSCAAVAVCGSALAVPLAPGDQVNLNGTTSAQNSWYAGVNQDGTQIVPFTIRDAQNNPVFQGTFTAAAARSFELGTIRMRYRLRDMQVIGNRAISYIEINGYGGLQTNVDYSLDGLGDNGPSQAQRNASGVRLTYVFNPLLLASQDSYFFWAFTNGTSFADIGQARIVLNTGESVVLDDVRVATLTDCPGDTNGDGVINFTDLNTVLSSFGDDCD